MTTNRRDFLRAAALAAGAATLRTDDAWALIARDLPPAPKKILILGGTGFIGPHQVNTALARGHEVTLFNRGKTNPEMFKGKVETLIGDRANNLESLKGRKWDAVIDNSAESGPTAPEWVNLSASLLKDSVDQYLFISTRSVYYDLSMVPATASAPTMSEENSPTQPGRARSYGLGKAMAERKAQEIMPGRVTIVRPGLIIGPGDDTDRFTYWPWRVARGGDMLAPGDGTDHVQIIDMRDLDEFVIKLVEDKTYGVFNGVGPQGGRPFKEFLELINKGVGGNPKLTWVSTDFLIENKANPYGPELPVFQAMRGKNAGFARFDITPELKAGLKFRPLDVTAKETLEWFRTLTDRPNGPTKGFKPDREKQLLELWRARKVG
jgi:nucleoside-diphosphate-sugar epimerase